MTMCLCVCVDGLCKPQRNTLQKRLEGKQHNSTQAICNYFIFSSITIQLPQGNIKTCICKYTTSQSSKEELVASSHNNTEVTFKELWQKNTITKLAHSRARRFAILCLTCIHSVHTEFYLHYT